MSNDDWPPDAAGEENFPEDELGFDEVPNEAREMIDKSQRNMAQIEQQLMEEIAEIKERAEKEIAALQRRARQKLRVQRLQLMDQLKPMMEAFAGKGKLDEALALRDQIRKLRADCLDVRKDPGNLLTYNAHIGRTFLFDVAGNLNGPVWGTDIYTADSNLATAAVHAGALNPGERAYVRVTVVDMTGMPIEGSQRNGVLTHPWGPYPFGYRVERA